MRRELDGARHRIDEPAEDHLDRLKRLLELLDAFPRSRQSCPKRELQRLLGELRSMVLAIPGGVGCLSWIQHQVKQAGERILLSPHFHDAMEDFRWLAKDVGGRPTRLAEVVPEVPLYTGTSDAAREGAGGVWLPDGDELYQAAVRTDTLAPSLATDRGPAVAAVVADRAAAHEVRPASTVRELQNGASSGTSGS